MTVTAEQVTAGQAVYTQRTLAAYDFVVLTISNKWIWRCSTRRLLEHYNTYVSANHLDVGVGTGYFLDRCQFPSAKPRVALLDLNPNSLDYASRRIIRYEPQAHRHNVLEPICLGTDPFDSVGMNYLLHCLPGSIESKSVAFDHLIALMKPNGVLFGSTLLQDGVRRNILAKRLMEKYNQQGIFSNRADDLEGLTAALRQRLRDVTIEVVGCAAIFAGRV